MASEMMIGPYTVIEEIGRGGMAAVYKAHDPKFNREVAIKVLPREMTHDPDFRTRFKREGEAIASLEHGAIVPVYDIGEADGQPYLVMRLMSGGSLAERIRQGQLELRDAVRIMERVASGLDAAHDFGIIHRDLKPGNILFDRYGNAFLSDFGIVKLSEGSTRDITIGMVGTPAYMAPEMMEPEGFDHRVDIYALTVTLYEMLTGAVPYIATTPGGILMAHVNKPIPDVRAVRPDLPKGVDDVIRLGMAKDPNQRYQTAGDLAAGLKEALETGTTTAYQSEATTQSIIDDNEPPPTIVEAHIGGDEPAATVPDQPTTPLMTRPAFLIGAGGAILLIVIVAGILATVALVTLSREEPVAAEPEATTLPIIEASPVSPTDPPAPTVTEADAETTPDALAELLTLATNGVERNDLWVPYTQEFGGVEMALVPAGCFMMGNRGVVEDETPEHEYCIEQPFWLDKTEVTNGDYAPVGDAATDILPRQSVSWFDAQAHCEDIRAGRLPTEVEWEYAASGPRNLFYPYGDNFDGNQHNYCDESCTNDDLRDPDFNDGFTERAPVGSYPGGASWVGALDMSGNVSEWVYSLFLPYPYEPDDGRESSITENNESPRAYRGGSYSSASTIMRTSWRNGISPDSAFTGIGFRCARDFDPAELIP